MDGLVCAQMLGLLPAQTSNAKLVGAGRGDGGLGVGEATRRADV
jgi:hypothetical protein